MFEKNLGATLVGPFLVGPKLVGPFFGRPSVRIFFEKFVHKGRLIKGQ